MDRNELYRRRMSTRPPSRVLPRVALATCRQWPLGDDDAGPLLAACATAGLDAEWCVWDDHAVDWSSYDLVVIRCTWDYAVRRDEFVRWAESVPRLANPADVVRWNTDKLYLAELAAAGLPVVPTTWLAPGAEVVLPAGDFVVKPRVGAGSVDTARYRPEHAAAGAGHAARLLAEGRPVMVQPYLSGVDSAGETALLFFGGRYSHSIGKAALLTGTDGTNDGLYREELVTAREPAGAERELARRVLAAVPGGPDRLLYARVDLLPGPDGPVLLEVELTEPSLFLGHPAGSGAAAGFAAAVARWVAPTAPPTAPPSGSRSAVGG